MKAVVYQGSNRLAVEDRTKPSLLEATDAIVKITHTSICGTDLHLLQDDIPCTPGRILGHEGVGIVDSLGSSATGLNPGQRVLISCITSCGYCELCRRGMASQCESGGWILGNRIDGTQAEFVRIPHAQFSLHIIPDEFDSKSAVMLSDAFPTAYECGVLNAQIQPGSKVAIIGAGPIGLAALVMVRTLFGPSQVVVIGRGHSRLDVARTLGADHTFSTLEGQAEAIQSCISLSDNGGFDAVIEAVGSNEAFEMSQALVAAGGTIASLGAYGDKCDLHLERLWHRNIRITTRLVDTISTPNLLRMVKNDMLRPDFLLSQTFSFDNVEAAYENFKAASKHNILKVVLTM